MTNQTTPRRRLRRNRRALVPAVGVVAGLVFGAGVGRAVVSPVQTPARSVASPAPAVDSRDRPTVEVLGKVILPRPRKGIGTPNDSWEQAWTNGRSFAPVPALPDLPADTAPTLALARLTNKDVVQHEDVVAAARTLGLDPAPRLTQEVLDVVLATARQAAAPLLRAAGIEVGTAVDQPDLLAAARVLGLDIGEVAGTDDVRRVLKEARAAASPVLWASHHDPGSNLDAGDLLAAGRRLGVDTAASLTALPDLQAMAARKMERVARTRVSPGLDRSTWQVTLPGGRAMVHVLRWSLDDPRIELLTHAAGGLDGRATIPQVHAAVTDHAAKDNDTWIPRVTVNGGFWMGSGDPDGLLIAGGTLLSDPTTRRSWVRGQRGAFGIVGDRAIVGRPDWLGQVVGEGTALEIRGVNRHLDLDHDLVAFTPHWGASTGTPAGTVELVLHDVTLGQHADADTVVTEVSTTGNAPIPPGGIVLAGTSSSARGLQDLADVGGPIRVSAATGDDWEAVSEGLGAGPLLLKDGLPTTLEQWHTEGFGDSHTLARHPRTAIGFTPDGEALLIVVDGRQPAWSVGMTTPETIRLLRAFGASDALMLDGGGSSHLVIGGRTANRPCCDAFPRSVSTALVIAERPLATTP